MIRRNRACAHTEGKVDSTTTRSAWSRGGFCVLLFALAFLAPLPAFAGSKKADARETRSERIYRHEARRGDVPNNARYKNQPRHARGDRDVPHNARYKNPPREHRGNDRPRHFDGRRDLAHRGDRHHGKRDQYYSKPHHHGKHYHRPRVVRRYDHFPRYAPVAVAYPYYCDLCHHGFYAKHFFYDHLCDIHHLSRPHIPGFLFSFGGTFYFGG